MNFCLETMIRSIFDTQKKNKIKCKWGINILIMNLAVEREDPSPRSAGSGCAIQHHMFYKSQEISQLVAV